MKTKPQTIKITTAENLDGYKIKLLFSDGKKQVVDFGPFLQKSLHPEVRNFLIPKYFKMFVLLDGDIMWGDFDLLFPIMDLYNNQLEHSQNKK